MKVKTDTLIRSSEDKVNWAKRVLANQMRESNQSA